MFLERVGVASSVGAKVRFSSSYGKGGYGPTNTPLTHVQNYRSKHCQTPCALHVMPLEGANRRKSEDATSGNSRDSCSPTQPRRSPGSDEGS